MTHCDYCGMEIQSETLEPVGRIITGGSYDFRSSPITLPFECFRCGGKYCSTHSYQKIMSVQPEIFGIEINRQHQNLQFRV